MAKEWDKRCGDCEHHQCWCAIDEWSSPDGAVRWGLDHVCHRPEDFKEKGMEKTFDLGTILTITTGKRLARIDSIGEILTFMTGDIVFTHNWPQAMELCKPYILRQLPILENVTGEDIDKYKEAFGAGGDAEDWQEILADLERRYGKYHSVKPISAWEILGTI